MGKGGDIADIEAELRAAGEADDDALDIAGLALAFAQADRPAASRAPYLSHLAELADAARKALARATPALAGDANVVATVLAGLVSGRFAYRGDSETYDDLKNADLMQVIDRRKGLPVSLGILYLHIARVLGLDLAGLNFPGHFVLRLQIGQSATIIDPFNRGQTLSTADLLNLLRSIEGPAARLSPEAYAPVGARDILLRLQNNILSRALKAGDHDRARDVVTRMIWLAPRRAGLQFELGRLEVHAGHMSAAATAFETCRNMASGDGEMRIADMASEALRRLKTKLN
ncbi:MAG: transglutaminase-like domain-containing protein [Parvibaculum sp.]|uniref:SirB1 family protein n=1 Tax=Parvibaculum sp. TaxID=2024848 RepID=UPI0025DD368E|nr:transglutaminase-like domain-containing protein [Parvibaculum sp.]MCE9648130.1 transglutaminase-like domain-containing protein [Parvibaculum sp.]